MKFTPEGQARFFYIILFSALFTIIGYFFPRLYLQRFDKTHYIDIAEIVSFDRKVYAPCDTAIAYIKANLQVDSEVVTRSRLMKVETEKRPPNNFKIIKTTENKGFVKRQPEPQAYSVDYPIPCNIEDGVYLFRAETSYKVGGVDKTETFETALFTIDHTERVRRPHK